MAATALNKDEIQEFHDSDEKVARDVAELARLIRESKHCVVYTGAGISTSSGISDFRGPSGVWTLRAKGEKPVSRSHYKMPTVGHMAVRALMEAGLVKYLVSQNTDGLHMKSGVEHTRLAELHGNTNKESCRKCGRVYLRDFRTRDAKDVHDHRTKRKCETCGEPLYDSIINFSESLPEQELMNARANSLKCDLAVVLGTSMRVTPACELPMLNPKSTMVIGNLQKTPYDDRARLVMHVPTDRLLSLLMQELGIEIPDYIFEFSFEVRVDAAAKTVEVGGFTRNVSELIGA